MRLRHILTVLGLLTAAVVITSTAAGTYRGLAEGRLAFGFPKGDLNSTEIYSVASEGTGLRRLTASPQPRGLPYILS